MAGAVHGNRITATDTGRGHRAPAGVFVNHVFLFWGCAMDLTLNVDLEALRLAAITLETSMLVVWLAMGAYFVWARWRLGKEE